VHTYFKPIFVEDLEWQVETSPVEYEYALDFMEKRVEGISKGLEKELIWILEHPAIYTLGTSAKEEDILDDTVPFIKTSRGGQVTYHGPGQKVIYVMMKMSRFGNDLKAYIRFLKDSVAKPLRDMGAKIIDNDSHVGLWVDHPEKGPSKIAFIGIRIRKGISFHGISLNVTPDLEAFSKIVPCGEPQEKITSLEDLKIPLGTY
jgi:lipoyl(octanoyl) transferase